MGPLVDDLSYLCNLSYGIIGKEQLNGFRLEQGGVLFYQCILGLCEDPDEVLLPKGIQLHPNGKTPLELRNEIRGLRYVKGPGGNKEDMVRLYHSIFRRHRRSLNDGQNIPLDPFP